jgi:hypothetical protein
MKKELVKIVFQDGTPEEKQLNITVYSEPTENGGTKLELAMASMEVMQSTEPSLVSHIYFNVFNMLSKLNEALENTNEYQDVHTLTREEFKQYLIKVKGLNIPD